MRKSVFTLIAAGAIALQSAGITLKGTITDKGDGEPLAGVTVYVENIKKGTTSDFDGNYIIDLPRGEHSVLFRYVGYEDFLARNINADTDTLRLDVGMVNVGARLGEVTVTAAARRNTDLAVIAGQKNSLLVQTGVSARQISKTQDKDASEVMKRVPGVSVIDGKFVMVRGLSQRYNNVWLNGSAVPSSEADSRAFAFDMIPSSQLDNMTIVKSPAPEYPADFTGGFIMINTKQLSAGNGLEISLGAGLNDRTVGRDFRAAKGSSTDWLGFDSGLRSLECGIKGNLNSYPGYEGKRFDLMNNGLNNDWTVKNRTALPDLKLNATFNHNFTFEEGQEFGLLAALHYNNTHRTLFNMENSLYGPYDVTNDKPVFLRKAVDNQYHNNVTLGGMLNFAFRPADKRHYFEWMNIFNQIAKDRYSDRTGFNAQPDNISDSEYYYSTRTTYSTQFTGRHLFTDDNRLDWSAGYSYAGRSMPDRRLIERTDRTDNTMGIYRISREYTSLTEHTASLNLNYQHTFDLWGLRPTIKTGAYGDFCHRDYRAREFQYGWEPNNNLPDGFMFFPNVSESVLIDSNYGPDKLYLYEEINFLNNYSASRKLAAGYLGVNVPWNKFTAYLGVRYEFMRQTLKLNTQQFQESLTATDYDYSDLFPSLNLTWHVNDKHQFRAAAGATINRPEFRELSPSVFYDFELGSDVMGNYDLKAAHIWNVDLRYEWYPSSGEQVSLALFYKHFKDPIEWTYTIAGGTDLIYSFVNARAANNYGVELDIRKNLDFIGMKDFSLSFNAALIKSKVTFPEGSTNIDRPMQGQSPYLINVGLFYSNSDNGWSAAALYNRIGKRIIGVGNRYGNAADGTSRNIPNSYEMPRNAIDLSVGKRFGNWEFKLSARDILGEKVKFTQQEEVTTPQGKRHIEQISRSYNPGRNFSLTASYKF